MNRSICLSPWMEPEGFGLVITRRITLGGHKFDICFDTSDYEYFSMTYLNGLLIHDANLEACKEKMDAVFQELGYVFLDWERFEKLRLLA